MPLDQLGPYKLEKLLGRGGMGAVYVGLHQATGERAAVKLLAAHLADDPSFRERFKQEIEALKRLTHPNIVQLHGYGEEDGHLYYVMELVDGWTLQDDLLAGRRFTWREVARIGIAIAQALKHAHDRGIIHRDLKPANLMIDRQDFVKLTDFGIAKLYGGANVTADGGVLGTADYMAPEQAAGKPVTARCDLYAAGSVLYALLTGRPPFTGRTVIEVVTALQKDAPIPVRRLAPDTPAEFEEIILQLLDKDPQKRIPTALALSNRLKAMEHGLSLETRAANTEFEPTGKDGSVESGSQSGSPSSAKTEVSSIHARATAPLDDDEYRFADDDATVVTGQRGAATPSANTRLSTQAGKKTGTDSDCGTDAGEPGQRSSSTSIDSGGTRFVVVSEDERRAPQAADESALKQWLLAAVLGAGGLVVIGGAIWLAARPPSADRLYQAIEAAADPERPASLAAVETEMARFRQLYPDDPRAAAVERYEEALAQYRHSRRLSRGARAEKAAALTPAERAYQQAARLSDFDPEAALARFEAIVAVFDERQPNSGTSDQPGSATTLALARQQIERLRPIVERARADDQQALQEQLERAERLAASDRRAAEEVWRGIVTLYNERPWARRFVERAQARLAPAEAAASDARERGSSPP
jgi:serine/threonine-protein kinase